MESKPNKVKKSRDFGQYQQIVEQSPVAICVQSKGEIVFINAAGLKFLGAENYKQIIGKSIAEFIEVNRREILNERFQRIMEGGKAVAPFEEKLIQSDGKEFYVEMEATPFHYNSKLAIQIVFRDLTKRKKIEGLLYQSRQDWEDIFNNITDMITLHDKDFNIIYANKAAKKMLNLPLMELAQKTKCFRYYHGTVSPPEGCPSCDCLTTGKPARFEIFEPFLNMFIEIRAMPRFDSDNQLIGLIHVARDVTERKRTEEEIKKAKDELEIRVEQRTFELKKTNEQLREEITERRRIEEALRESENKFRNLSEQFNVLLDAISDNLLLLSPDLKIKWANKAAACGFDKKSSELAGQYCYQMCCHLTSPCEDCPAIKSFISGREEAIQILTSEGKFWDLRVFPMKNEAGGVENIIEVARDISERVKLQAETMRTRHLASLGELAAGVAHEINNPINNILNYAQILIDEFEKERRDNDIARRIIRDSDRIATIVRSLLSFARVKKEEKIFVSLNEILSDTFALTTAQIRKEGIHLRMDLPSDPPEIFAHPQEIQQVFLNIISNSRFFLNKKYPESHKEKIIEVSCEETKIDDNKFIQIVFYDSGTGIPAHILDKVINPFFTTKPNGTGTGLGLSISHRIITDHGGKLTVDSVEGEFTRITILFPLEMKS